jgi:HAD superfamily hydrolase (TIGR01549 family)
MIELRPTRLRDLAQTDAYEGFIFDLDGTIADTMGIHRAAFAECFEWHTGYALDIIPEKERAKRRTLSVREIISWLNHEHSCRIDVDTFIARKEQLVLERLCEVRPIEPVVGLVMELAQGKRKISVATNSGRDVAMQMLGYLELNHGDYFSRDRIVTIDDAVRGKPAPDLLLECARRMGVAPSSCVMLGDSAPDFEAAQAAGMGWVNVTRFCQSHHGERSVSAPGDSLSALKDQPTHSLARNGR